MQFNESTTVVIKQICLNLLQFSFRELFYSDIGEQLKW